MNYLISYDLNKSEKNYEGLIEAIKGISNGVWCTPCKSTWMIQSTLQSANAVFESLKQEIDSDDSIIITGITKDISGQGETELIEFIKKHFM